MNLLFLLALAIGPDAVEDFEDGLPDGWERISSDAHPPYNTIDIVHDPKGARSGEHYLRMRSMGGLTGYGLSTRRGWAVDPTRPYRLSVFARLTGTRRNAAVATLTWLNGDGNRISEVRSATVTKPGEWTEIILDLIVPPGAVAAAPRLDFDGDDVRGTCDFDKLVLGPVERLDLRPDGRATAVFAPEEYPRFAVSLTGAAGPANITVKLTTASGAVHHRSAPSGGTVDFPPPGPGVHEVVASVDGRNVERKLTLLVANPWNSTGDPLPEIPPALLQATVRGPATDAEGRPTSAWLAERALHQALEGSTPLPDPGFFPAGVRAAAFRKKDSAVLALWTDADELEVPVTMNDGAKLYPPLGAIRALRAGERLRVGPMPVFLLGIDPLLFELRLTLSGGDLPLQLNPVTRTLRFHNPSRQPLRDVRIRIQDAPAGWKISPREMWAPAIAAGGEFSEELQLLLPALERERVEELRFEVSFVRNGKEHVVRLSRAVQLAPVLKVDTVVADGPQRGSKKLTVRITNTSDRPMTLALRARIPQHPEQNELLRDLAPGGTSAPFVYVVKDVALLDPTHAQAEIDVQESLGARAAVRRIVPLR